MPHVRLHFMQMARIGIDRVQGCDPCALSMPIRASYKKCRCPCSTPGPASHQATRQVLLPCTQDATTPHLQEVQPCMHARSCIMPSP